MPNRRILGGWYEFFDDNQQPQSQLAPGGIAAALSGHSSVLATLTVAAPAPSPSGATGGGGGSWGGGGGSPVLHEYGMQTVTVGEFVDIELPDVSNEVVQAGMIRALRKKISALETYAESLKAGNATSLSRVANELVQAQRLIETLARTVEALELRAIRDEVKAKVFGKGLRMAGFERNTGVSDVVIALAALLAAEVLIPDEWRGVKGVARVVAFGALLRAL